MKNAGFVWGIASPILLVCCEGSRGLKARLNGGS